MSTIHKKKVVEADVLSLARRRMKETFDLHDTVVVSFSGGKDSTAVLNLAADEARARGRLPLEVVFFDEEAIPYETEAYVRRVAQRPDINLNWYCLPAKYRNACSRKSPFWYPWDEADRPLWVRPLPPEAITMQAVPGFPRDREDRPTTVGGIIPLLYGDAVKWGRVAMVIGIRGQESLVRMRAILMNCSDNRPYMRKWTDSRAALRHLTKVYPIYDWNTSDVWAAPSVLGWDYNTSYDNMDKAGIPFHAQRVAPPYGEEPMRGLWVFRESFPDVWDGMCARVPGAATAARYATTQLYAFGSVPPKPEGMSWQEWVRFWVAKHPPGFREAVSKRVQELYRNHRRKTPDPLATSIPHPLTGCSWAGLVLVAVRGDWRGRKEGRVTKQTTPEQWSKYHAEIADMRARGELET